MNIKSAFTQTGTYYQVSGATNADTLVLIHGLGLDLHTWDQYIDRLSQNYQVVRYDLLGHGQSVPAVTATPQYSLTSFSEQLKQLLDELNIEQCCLIGFSLGGMINRRFAIDYANRVSSLVILNSPHERDPKQQKLVEQSAADSATVGVVAGIDAIIERWFTASFRQSHPHIVGQIKGKVLSNPLQYYAACRQVLASGVIELIRPTPAIDKPCLIITGENDSGSTPSMSDSIGAEIAKSTVIIIPQLQHLGLIEQPELFLKPITEFLSSLKQ